METIIGCVITGVLSLVGVILTNNSSNKKIENNLEKNQAVTDTKIEELTREVRQHNSFAQRIPVLEVRIEELERKMKDEK